MPTWCNGSALDTTDVSVGVRILSWVRVRKGEENGVTAPPN